MPSGRRPTSHSLDGHNRPTWWILLTITLAVVAVTFAHIGMSTRSRRSSPFSSVAPTGRDTRNDPSLPLHSSKEKAPLDNSPALYHVDSNQGSTAPATTQSSLIPPTAAAPAGDPITTQPVTTTPSNGDETISGYLSYPDNIESFISIPAVTGAITVSAAWSTGAPLGLSIVCSSSTQTMTGTSALHVSTSAGDSPCTVRLYEESPTSEPVPYTLNVLKP
jgi:hypothetical protein